MKGCFYLQYRHLCGRCCTRDKERQRIYCALKDENFSMQWDSLEDFSSLKFGFPENEAFAQGMRLYQQTEGKRVGLHYLLPLYEQDTKAHAFLQQQMDLQDKP
jgi:hypothetical protein